jgi:hypothetical protein
MTKKKDLKRRVRERKAMTGESYTAARAHVVAQAERAPAIQVEELLDVSAPAATLGFRCQVLASSALVPARRILERLCDALRATESDLELEGLRALAFRGERFEPQSPRAVLAWERLIAGFLRRVRAGIGGVSPSGDMLALPVAAPEGVVLVLCHAGHPAVPGRVLARDNTPRLILTPVRIAGT